MSQTRRSEQMPLLIEMPPEKMEPFLRGITEVDEQLYQAVMERLLRRNQPEKNNLMLCDRVEEVLRFLASPEGIRFVEEQRVAMGGNFGSKEIGANVREGYYVPLEAVFPGSPKKYCLIVLGKQIGVGRLIETDNPRSVDISGYSGDLNNLLAGVASEAWFRQIMSGTRPLVGLPLSLKVEYDGQNVEVVLMEMIRSDLIANNSPLEAAEIYEAMRRALSPKPEKKDF